MPKENVKLETKKPTNSVNVKMSAWTSALPDPTRPDPKEKDSLNGYAAEFESWWACYPRRVAKAAAAKAHAKALKKISAAELNRRTTEYAKSVKDSDPQFIPYPATWLNQCRYDDDSFSSTDPEQIIRKAWTDGPSFNPEIKKLGSNPFYVEWPTNVDQLSEKQKADERSRQWRSWIEKEHATILQRLKGA